MSSMVRAQFIAAVLASAVVLPAPAFAQWESGRDNLVAQQPSQLGYAVDRWEQLTASPNFTFEDYAGFLLSYPGFPDETVLRGHAEARLADQYVAADRLVAFFDRFPPQTNPGRAQYALALMAMRATLRCSSIQAVGLCGLVASGGRVASRITASCARPSSRSSRLRL